MIIRTKRYDCGDDEMKIGDLGGRGGEKDGK